jgi:dihydroorotase-like cyclic amidohydrolase
MAILTLPGLIDPHVHLRDPGQTEKEDFYTGTAAALHGGYTTLLDMPNNLLPVTSLERLEEKVASAREKIVCDVGFYFGSLGDNLDRFLQIQNSVFGLKLFLNHTTGDYIIDEEKLSAIYTAWPGKKPILVHAEDKAVELVIRIIKETGKRTHICHVSNKFELDQIITAKEKGLPITCGVTPHHLFLSSEDEGVLGPLVKVRPPLRSREDVAYLWKHLRAIDVIESDHAPHLLEEKRSDNPPNGMPGLETALPLLLTAVSENRLSIDDVIRLCHTGPARCFGVPIHHNTNVTVDVHAAYEIKNENLFTKSKWSPFAGQKVRGKVRSVILRGTTVFENDKVLAAPGSGHLLTPAP